jgi:hypothetical protein
MIRSTAWSSSSQAQIRGSCFTKLILLAACDDYGHLRCFLHSYADGSSPPGPVISSGRLTVAQRSYRTGWFPYPYSISHR